MQYLFNEKKKCHLRDLNFEVYLSLEKTGHTHYSNFCVCLNTCLPHIWEYLDMGFQSFMWKKKKRPC